MKGFDKQAAVVFCRYKVALSHPTDPSKDRSQPQDERTILPAGDMDRTIPGNSESDRTIPGGQQQDSPGGGIGEGIFPRVEARLDRIADCKIEKRLGSGGFGDVWLAVQESDLLKRRVAIKLLKRGMDSEAVLERFDLERKVLNTLNHPNIARLFGGGVTEDGRSYFIMEFVEGLTLEAWCERQTLGVPERLSLLRQIASALAHAHEKGIVHRDIKPANVLVGVDGVPKLLDFGIAKIVNPDVNANDRSHQTLPGEIGPLTPVYASPEQLRGEPLAASTDVYSFGVMMYEILSGRPPFDFTNLPFDEVRRQVCETMPLRPSDKGTMTVVKGDGKTTTGGSTGSATDRLRKGLRGDLDNIVLMAMRKETARRYASMPALIADIDAFLEGRPVSARPNSAGYRATKWLGRNRIRVMLATASVVAVAGSIAWWVYAKQAAEAQAAADQAAAIQKTAESEAAKKVIGLGSNVADYAAEAKAAEQVLVDAEASARQQLKADPTDAQATLRLVRALYKRAGLMERSRNVRDGLPLTSELVELARSLESKSKSDADRRTLMLALRARGDMFLAANELPQARQVLAESLALAAADAAKKPDEVDMLRDHGTSLARMRNVLVQERDFAGAIAIDDQLKQVRGSVFRRGAKNDKDGSLKARFERDWMLAHFFRTSDLFDLGRFDDAEAELATYLDISRQRVEAKPDEWERQFDVAYGLAATCGIASERLTLPEWETAADQWIEASRAAVDISQSESVALRIWVDANLSKAHLQNHQKKFSNALELVRSTVKSAERMRAAASTKGKGEAIAPEQRMMVWAEEMRSLRGLDRLPEAREIVKQVTALAAQPMESVEWNTAVAWAMVQAAAVAEAPADAERFARLAIKSAEATKEPVLEGEARESLVAVLLKAKKTDAAEAERAKAIAVLATRPTPRSQEITNRLAKPAAPKAATPASPPASGKPVAPPPSTQAKPPAQSTAGGASAPPSAPTPPRG